MENDPASVPRLSPSQRAYREDPQGFLERLDERAATLFESGYRVRPSGDDEAHLFVVTYSERGGEVTEYPVRPQEGSCGCPFYGRQANGGFLGVEEVVFPCKHLLGLSGLIRKTRQELYEKGRIKDFCALSMHWMKHLSALRKERIRQAEEETERVKVHQTAPVPSPATTRRQSHQSSGSGIRPSGSHRSCGASGWQSSGKENFRWRR